MRIDQNLITNLESDRLNEAKKAADAKRTAEAKTVQTPSIAATDSVTLSYKAREITDITLQLKESSDVREEKVQELRTRILDGTYHVDGLSIAGKIVDKAIGNIF